MLVIATHVANLFSAREQPERDFLISNKAQDPIIIRLGRMLSKGAFSFLIQLISICYFGNATHRYLRGQLKFNAKVLIGDFMQIELPKGLGLPSPFGKPVTCHITTFKRQTQSAFLIRRRVQFEVSDKLHTLKYRIFLSVNQSRDGTPKPPKGGGLQPQFL
uniref:hypothetical protein n=1 Tax=Nitrosococcus watsonii TaxID=473531 RepID=UPI002FC35DF9